MTDDLGTDAVSRRGFFAATAGAAAATAAAASGSAGAQDDDEEEEAPGDDLPGAGQTETVIVGPGGDLVYDPDELYILPGTTVRFIWESDNHNLNVQSGPEGGWDGYDDLEDTGFEYEHTFEVEGEYEYVCDPHVAAGMEAVIIVTEDIPDDDDGPTGPVAPSVPDAAMSLAIGTIAAMASTLTLAYFFMKYGGTSEA